MKRGILCPSCAEKTAQTITGCKIISGQIVITYTGEHAKFQTGILTRLYICDDCGSDLEISTKATALSIWADYGGILYYSWESEFLTLK